MMTKNTSFSLSEHYIEFIETQVASGRYSNASEVVRAGLRLLEEDQQRLEALREALREGEESGVSEDNALEVWAEFELEQAAAKTAKHE